MTKRIKFYELKLSNSLITILIQGSYRIHGFITKVHDHSLYGYELQKLGFEFSLLVDLV